jgi:3-oxoacyl-[acyl-carrier protein] reductase
MVYRSLRSIHSCAEARFTMMFEGSRVVVAGASRGIGRAIALAFAQQGAAVSICARGVEALERTRDELAQFTRRAHARRCDLADEGDIRDYVAAAAEELGGIDVLINNATGSGLSDTEEGWAASISVDLMAVVRASRAAVPWLERSQAAAIVNIASISGLRASLRTPPYGAAKAAVIHYTATQAGALAEKRIRVNCVAPGSVEFEGGVWDRRRMDEPHLYERVRNEIPFGRMGVPEDIANVVTFLASPLAGWVTGQTIVADGGQMLRT